jgi:hypothetical protein
LKEKEMSTSAQLGPVPQESLLGTAGKFGISIYQVTGGLVIGAAAMTMMSGGRIEIDSLTGPYKFFPAATVQEPVRSARALTGSLLKPEIAAVCEKSSLLGKTVGIFTLKMDNAFSVRAVRYVPCTKEESTQEIIFLHGDDMKRIAKDVSDAPRQVRVHVIDKEPVMPLGKEQELALN